MGSRHGYDGWSAEQSGPSSDIADAFGFAGYRPGPSSSNGIPYNISKNWPHAAHIFARVSAAFIILGPYSSAEMISKNRTRVGTVGREETTVALHRQTVGTWHPTWRPSPKHLELALIKRSTMCSFCTLSSPTDWREIGRP